MKNKRVIRLLNTLRKEELKAFKSYLFKLNRKEKLMCRIFQYYYNGRIKAHPPNQWLELTIAYRKICREEINSKKQKVFLNALHDLNKALKDFLINQALEKDSFEKDQILIKIYQERNLQKETYQLIENRKAKILNTLTKNQWADLHLFQLDYKLFFEIKGNKIADNSILLMNMMYHLDHFFCTLKLLVNLAMTNRKNLYHENYEVKFINEIYNFLEENPPTSTIAANLYICCLDAIKIRNLERTNKLATFLKDYESSLSMDNQNLAFNVLLNCWMQLYKEGHQIAAKKLFSLYKKGLLKGFFYRHGQMSPNTFGNIVTTACLVKEFEWCSNFIDKYQGFLKEPDKSASINLAKGAILYSKGAFKEMLSPLSKVEYLDSSYAIRAKGMMLKGYYEDKVSHDLISAYCKAFMTFLEEHQQFQIDPLNSYKRLIKYVRIFIRRKRGISKIKLIEQIQAEENFQFKSWTLEKVEVLFDT